MRYTEEFAVKNISILTIKGQISRTNSHIIYLYSFTLFQTDVTRFVG
jgi:hypothetical protein